MRILLASLVASSSLLAACASDAPVDELAGETADDDVVDGKADAAADGAYTFFAVRGDVRRCAYPQCGGFHLERLNRSTTKCHDGSTSAACYVPDLDWSESGVANPAARTALLDAAAKSSFAAQGISAIVRGRFAPAGVNEASASLGRFIVTEAWVAEGDGAQADGVFVRVKDAGVRCISSPCESMIERGLNTSRTAGIAAVDFSEAGLSDEQQAELGYQMFEPGGIIVAGHRFTVRENGRTARGRTATVAYRRVTDATAQGACFVGGCSGQICSDREGVISTCEWREEYACYAQASCERQADGACGWTPTAELNACLGSAN